MKTLPLRAVALLIAGLAAAAPAAAQPGRPRTGGPPGPAALEPVPILREVGVDQKLDEAVPLDLPFVDEAGREVRLGEFFGRRAVVLSLVYYECPMLCTQVLTGLASSLDTLPFEPGRDFELVVVSFDPGETPAHAAGRRRAFLERYNRPDAEGVHFLTGRESSIRALTGAVGFRYVYDEASGQYAHPAVTTVLTAEGRVSRYLFGIEFAPRDFRLALVEAAEHRIGGVVEQALLYCYHYDPTTGKYGLAIMNVIRLGGVLTVLAVGTFIGLSLRRERRRRHAVEATATGNR